MEKTPDIWAFETTRQTSCQIILQIAVGPIAGTMLQLARLSPIHQPDDERSKSELSQRCGGAGTTVKMYRHTSKSCCQPELSNSRERGIGCLSRGVAVATDWEMPGIVSLGSGAANYDPSSIKWPMTL